MKHVDLINKWPSLSAFAGDIGVSYGTAKAMRRRGVVPPEYWVAAVEGAARRDIAGITLSNLAAGVDRRRAQSASSVEAA